MAADSAADGPSRAGRRRARSFGHFGNQRVRYVLEVLVLAVLYRAVAQVGYALQFAGPVAAVVWLPVGIGIAFVYLRGLRYWPGVLIGDLLANDYGALPLSAAIGQTCGNVLEVVAAAIVLRRRVPSGDPLGSVRGLGWMLVAFAVAAAVSATVANGILLAEGVVEAPDLLEVWRTWWLGDFCGALIVVPLALAWSEPMRGWLRRRGVETAVVLGVVAAASVFAWRSSETLTYLAFPALMWSALRLGRRGATLAVAVTAGFAVWETTRREGPFAFESITHSILATQLYLAVSTLSTLCVAAVVAEREGFAERLRASRARIVEAGERERRRIERDLHDGAQQRLTGLSIRLRLAAEKAQEAPATAVGQLQAAEIEVDAAIEELRELAHGILPAVLTMHGLAHALKRLAAESPLALRLVELPATRADPTAEATAYFVISETVANARKHAHATSIEVRARTSHGLLRVEVADDGVGGASETRGTGLQGLRDRVEAISGSFEIVSPPGRGTRIVATMPERPAGA